MKNLSHSAPLFSHFSRFVFQNSTPEGNLQNLIKDIQKNPENADTNQKIAEIQKLVSKNKELLKIINEEADKMEPQKKEAFLNLLKITEDINGNILSMEITKKVEFKEVEIPTVISMEIKDEPIYKSTEGPLQKEIFDQVKKILEGNAVFTNSKADNAPQKIDIFELQKQCFEKKLLPMDLTDKTAEFSARIISAAREFLSNNYGKIQILIVENEKKHKEVVFFNQGSAKEYDEALNHIGKVTGSVEVSKWGRIFTGININTNKYENPSMEIVMPNLPEYDEGYRKSFTNPTVDYWANYLGFSSAEMFNYQNEEGNRRLDEWRDLNQAWIRLQDPDKYFRGHKDNVDYYAIKNEKGEIASYVQNYDKIRYERLKNAFSEIKKIPAGLSMEQIDENLNQIAKNIYGIKITNPPSPELLLCKGFLKDTLRNNNDAYKDNQELKYNGLSDKVAGVKLSIYDTPGKRNAISGFIQRSVEDFLNFEKNSEVFTGIDVDWDALNSTFTFQVAMNPAAKIGGNSVGMDIVTKDILAIKTGIQTELAKNTTFGDINIKAEIALMLPFSEKSNISTESYNINGLKANESGKIIIPVDDKTIGTFSKEYNGVMPLGYAKMEFRGKEFTLIKDEKNKNNLTVKLDHDMYLPTGAIEWIAEIFTGKTGKNINEESDKKANIKRDISDWIPPVYQTITFEYPFGKGFEIKGGVITNLTEGFLAIAYNEPNVLSCIKEARLQLDYKATEQLNIFTKMAASSGLKGNFDTWKQTWQMAIGAEYDFQNGFKIKGEVVHENIGTFNNTGVNVSVKYSTDLLSSTEKIRDEQFSDIMRYQSIETVKTWNPIEVELTNPPAELTSAEIYDNTVIFDFSKSADALSDDSIVQVAKIAETKNKEGDCTKVDVKGASDADRDPNAPLSNPDKNRKIDQDGLGPTLTNILAIYEIENAENKDTLIKKYFSTNERYQEEKRLLKGRVLTMVGDGGDTEKYKGPGAGTEKKGYEFPIKLVQDPKTKEAIKNLGIIINFVYLRKPDRLIDGKYAMTKPIYEVTNTDIDEIKKTHGASAAEDLTLYREQSQTLKTFIEDLGENGKFTNISVENLQEATPQALYDVIFEQIRACGVNKDINDYTNERSQLLQDIETAQNDIKVFNGKIEDLNKKATKLNTAIAEVNKAILELSQYTEKENASKEDYEKKKVELGIDQKYKDVKIAQANYDTALSEIGNEQEYNALVTFYQNNAKEINIHTEKAEAEYQRIQAQKNNLKYRKK